MEMKKRICQTFKQMVNVSMNMLYPLSLLLDKNNSLTLGPTPMLFISVY